LKNLYDALINIDKPCEYWNEFLDLNNRKKYKKTLKMYIDIIKINQHNQYKIYEEPLDHIANSNINWAWMQIKNNL
jgi:hypothetical protein